VSYPPSYLPYQPPYWPMGVYGPYPQHPYPYPPHLMPNPFDTVPSHKPGAEGPSLTRLFRPKPPYDIQPYVRGLSNAEPLSPEDFRNGGHEPPATQGPSLNGEMTQSSMKSSLNLAAQVLKQAATDIESSDKDKAAKARMRAMAALSFVAGALAAKGLLPQVEFLESVQPSGTSIKPSTACEEAAQAVAKLAETGLDATRRWTFEFHNGWGGSISGG
jgi:hypothetical protein